MPSDYALLIIRVAVGLIFLAHGIKHARGREKTSNWFGSIGFRQAEMQWFASSATEIGVGVFLILGVATQFAAAGVIAIMTVAYISVHRHAGFWVTARPDEGWEYVFVLAAVAFAIAIGGPGSVSIDDALGITDDLDGWVGLGIAVLGVLAAFAQVAIFYRPSEAESGDESGAEASTQNAFPQD
jgi:putative oxidoreductase